MRILVIIPAYNEEENIVSTLKELRSKCPELDLVVVSDGSTDRTAALCREQGCAVLELPVNLGIGGCLQTGYLYALERGYDAAVQFDADGQHDAAYVPAVLAPLEAGTADLAIGSRFLGDGGFRSTAARRLGSGFLSKMLRLLCGLEVRDVTSGMRAAGRKAIALFAEIYAQDYPELDALLAADMAGLRVTEVPVVMRPRLRGKSSITALKSVYFMIRSSLAMLLRRGLGRRKPNAQ